MGTDGKVAEESWLVAAVDSDPEAFVRLYRRHYDAVFRYCAHRLFDRTAAEDVTSQVFLKVVENLDSFRGNGRQFRFWLYKIATNAVSQHFRSVARYSNLLDRACERIHCDADDCGEPPEKLVLLREAMLALRPRYQTIITLRFFENLKLTEIAEVLGGSPATIRSQLARALARLRRVLGREYTNVSGVTGNER